MKIIKYKDAHNIVVEFQDEYKTHVHCEYKSFKKGKVRNPYDKTVFDIGYMGQGKYKAIINKRRTKAHMVWENMLMRCYDPYYINEHTTYINCYVCKEWHNFQNFAKWYEENYYEVPNERMELDKDLLFKGNKIYSPQTCIFVPQRINLLFTKANKKRGELPIGVTFSKKKNKFQSQCCIGQGKRLFLGYHTSPIEAFKSYKNFKENYIKQIANEYKELIPQKLYDALYKWEVKIDD